MTIRLQIQTDKKTGKYWLLIFTRQTCLQKKN